jgi:cytochrome c-type biogenesis protein CcmF
LVLMTVAPWVSWRTLERTQFFARLTNVLALTIGLVGCTLLFTKGWGGGLPSESDAKSVLFLRFEVPQIPFVVSMLAVCFFAVAGNLWRLVETSKLVRMPAGGLLAHVGVALAMTGLVFSRALEQREVMSLTPLGPSQGLGRMWMAGPPTSNFADRNNRIRIRSFSTAGQEEFFPGFYYLPPRQEGEPRPVSWPAVHSKLLYDLYLVVGEMFFEATEPTLLRPGEERALQSAEMLVRYDGLDVQGTPGTQSAVFGAKVHASFLDGRKLDVMPTFSVASGPRSAVIDDDLAVRVDRIDAATGAAAITVLYRRPAYAVEVFYKPLTVLVWWGVGIMGLGGLVAAWQRRIPPTSNTTGETPSKQDDEASTALEGETPPREGDVHELGVLR